MRHTELFYTIALRMVPGVGDVSARKLIAAFGSATDSFTASAKELQSAGLNQEQVSAMRAVPLDRVEQEIRFLNDHGIDTFLLSDENYPYRLRHIPDAPIILFSKGNMNLTGRKVLSIVGTRNLTLAGAAFCRELIESLSPLDPVIVSGLAFGADIAAHQAAVSCGLQTIGVVAHGLDRIYPQRHTSFARTMVEMRGGLLTEFTSGTEPMKQNFVQRNRIVAGLSEATIVIESAEKGGSLITANFANDYNREVFAVPGRPGDALAHGCNNLIKSQKAHMITCAADLVYLLGWDTHPKPVQKKLFVELGQLEQKIYDYLIGRGREMIDVIATDCGLPVFELSPALLNMELKGVVRPLPGKLFEAI